MEERLKAFRVTVHKSLIIPDICLRHAPVWCGVVWCGVVWCGVVWCGVVWCGVVWCGVVWCDVVWCDVVWWSLTVQRFFPRSTNVSMSAGTRKSLWPDDRGHG